MPLQLSITEKKVLIDNMAFHLSPVQKQVLIDLFSGNWHIAAGKDISPSACMQQGGIGKGGPSKKITHATIYALYTRKLIAQTGDTNTSYIYSLTELGKKLAKKLCGKK